MKGWIYFSCFHYSDLPHPGPSIENPQGSPGMAPISWAAQISSFHGALIFLQSMPSCGQDLQAHPGTLPIPEV